MRFWANLVGYQLVWFIAVIFAGAGKAWPGALAAVLFVTWQLAISRHRMVDLRLMVTAVLTGLLIDGGLSLAGWLIYAAPASALPAGGAPLWILGMWAAFSLTLNESLKFLQERRWLAAAFGAIGAPLAYLGAARAWQAVTFVAPAWHAVAGLAIGWSVAMVVLVTFARRRRSGRSNVDLLVLPGRSP